MQRGKEISERHGERRRKRVKWRERREREREEGNATHKSLDRDTCTSLRAFSLSLFSLFSVGSLVHLLPSTDEHRRQASRFMPVRGITRGQLSLVTVGGILDEGFSRSLVGCLTFKILPFVRPKDSSLPLVAWDVKALENDFFLSRVYNKNEAQLILENFRFQNEKNVNNNTDTKILSVCLTGSDRYFMTWRYCFIKLFLFWIIFLSMISREK